MEKNNSCYLAILFSRHDEESLPFIKEIKKIAKKKTKQKIVSIGRVNNKKL